MKVLHILAELRFSGAEIMYTAAGKTFNKLGCELFVANTSVIKGEYAPFFEKAGYKVMYWPIESKPSLIKQLAFSRKVQKFVRDNHIDVIHVHRNGLKVIMAFTAWKCGIRSIYTYHNVFPSRKITYPYHVLQRFVAKKVFKEIQQTISDSVYEHERDYYHNETFKVYNWYNTKKFFPANDGEMSAIREELGIPQNSLVIISIGGCSIVKRHEDVIYAMDILRKDLDVIYLHLGEGDTLEEEKKIAANMGVDNRIMFLGNQTNVRKFLIASDIYVMPSRFEGISITTIEAMACKIPAILYAVPGLKDFNKDAECSVQVKEDPALLAEAILQLYHDQCKQKRMIENAYTLVREKYDMERNVKEIFELYTS